MVSITQMAFLAVVMTMAVLFTLRRIAPWRIIFGYAIVIDVSFTVGMLMMFSGTVTGAASATLAGLFLAMALTIGRMLVGADRLVMRRRGLSVSFHVKHITGGWIDRPKAGKRMQNAADAIREWFRVQHVNAKVRMAT